MATIPIPRGYRLVSPLPDEINLPSGQVAYRHGVTFSIRRGGTSGEGPDSLVLPSGQRATRTRRGSYRLGRNPEVNPRRVHFDPRSRQYYESPSHPEQALRNPQRYSGYINRQVQRDPQWLQRRLDRTDRSGSRLGNRLARQEIAAPRQHRWIIEHQRSSGDLQTANVLVEGHGTTPVALTSIERSIVSQHWNAVHRYVSGQPNDLWRFRGVRVGVEGHLLMTDEYEIDEAGNRGELNFESMYPVTYPVTFGGIAA